MTEEMIADEYYEHGELKNNLWLLEYGLLLLRGISQHHCTLSELLNGISIAAQRQIADHKFNMRGEDAYIRK